MPRKSKLSEDQWTELLDRHEAGETVAALATEYGISYVQIYARKKEGRVLEGAVVGPIVKNLSFDEVNDQTVEQSKERIALNYLESARLGSEVSKVLRRHALRRLREEGFEFNSFEIKELQAMG